MNRYLRFIFLLALIVSTESKTKGDGETVNRSTGVSFQKGSHRLNPGIFYGGSWVGIEYEYGVLNFLGIELGGGYPGMNFGPNIHFYRSHHTDLYVAPNYYVSFRLKNYYAPFINFGSRFYFGESAKIGISAFAGIGYKFDSDQSKSYGLFLAGIGVPIRLN
jgi:hypothetical protein